MTLFCRRFSDVFRFVFRPVDSTQTVEKLNKANVDLWWANTPVDVLRGGWISLSPYELISGGVVSLWPGLVYWSDTWLGRQRVIYHIFCVGDMTSLCCCGCLRGAHIVCAPPPPHRRHYFGVKSPSVQVSDDLSLHFWRRPCLLSCRSFVDVSSSSRFRVTGLRQQPSPDLARGSRWTGRRTVWTVGRSQQRDVGVQCVSSLRHSACQSLSLEHTFSAMKWMCTPQPKLFHLLPIPMPCRIFPQHH